MNLKGRNFLTLKDFTPEEINYLLDLSAELKAKKKNGELHEYYKGKNIALIFEKTSTRTRCAFEVAAHDLGMGSTYLDPSGSQIGKKESIADTARVLGRMYDGIEYRGFGQEIVEELAKYAGVPVWNGLTNEYHPTQMLADMLTIRENFGRLKGIKLVYLGDARYNMGNSYMIACSKMGMDFVACAPKKYFPDSSLVEQCREIVRKFNQLYGETLVEPEIILPENASCMRLPGLDGKAKMSKSLGNCIYLSDEPDQIEKKVMSMYTDPNHLSASDPGRVEGNPVFIYLDAFCKPEDFAAFLPEYSGMEELKEHYRLGGLGDVKVKRFLNQVLQEELRPIRQRRKEWERRLPEIYDILKEGSKVARKKAEQTLEDVRHAMRIDYFDEDSLLELDDEGGERR